METPAAMGRGLVGIPMQPKVNGVNDDEAVRAGARLSPRYAAFGPEWQAWTLQLCKVDSAQLANARTKRFNVKKVRQDFRAHC